MYTPSKSGPRNWILVDQIRCKPGSLQAYNTVMQCKGGFKSAQPEKCGKLTTRRRFDKEMIRKSPTPRLCARKVNGLSNVHGV